jgi:tetratricopeptide (TPR) repeat protein
LKDFDRAIKELELGNYSEGMVILQKLLKDDPDNPDILYNLGICYSEMGLVNKSIETLEKCMRVYPLFANALVALGFSYNRAGHDDRAMASFLKALEIEPDNFYALKNIAALYNKQGEPDLAIDAFTKAEALLPGTPEVVLGLAQAYELKGDYVKATDLYKKAKDADASDGVIDRAIEGLNRLAIARAKDGGQILRSDAVMCCLSAIEAFSKMSAEKIKEIAFEVAMLGTSGLSINEPEKKYTLKSLEGRFSGMQLLCFMFVGFKIIDTNLPPVADLEAEYRQALKLYRSKLDEH